MGAADKAAAMSVKAEWYMDEGYAPQAGIPQLSMPSPWWIYWLEGDPLGEGVQGHFRPETSQILKAQYDYRVKIGNGALKIHNTDATHHYIVATRVPVLMGADYTFSIWEHVWTGDSADPRKSNGDKYNYATRIGIDPQGRVGEPFKMEGIAWSDWVGQEMWDTYYHHQVAARASASYVTLMFEGKCKWRTLHNDAYWDFAQLYQEGGNGNGGGEVDLAAIRASLGVIQSELGKIMVALDTA